jgi:hypothetical protein
VTILIATVLLLGCGVLCALRTPDPHVGGRVAPVLQIGGTAPTPTPVARWRARWRSRKPSLPADDRAPLPGRMRPTSIEGYLASGLLGVRVHLMQAARRWTPTEPSR